MISEHYAQAIAEARKRHGILPPLLFVAGDPIQHQAATLEALKTLGYGEDDLLMVDLAEVGPAATEATAETIRTHVGPVFLANVDDAGHEIAIRCLNPETLGPLCRPVFASSRSSDIPTALKPFLQMVPIAAE